MSLSVSYFSATDAKEAYSLAKAQITPEYVSKFNVACDIDYSPASNTISAKGKGFSLSIVFKETKCDVKLELSFLLKPLKNKVLDTVESKLKRTI